MDLYEYQGKELFARFGIPVSEGRVAVTPAEARTAAEELGGPVVVKAQVLTGGRGKAGGVKLADDPADAEAKARDIIGLDIRGHVVEKLWIEKASDIAKILLLGHVRLRAKQPLFMFTTQGGWRSRTSPRTTLTRCALLTRPAQASSRGRAPARLRRWRRGPSEQKQIAAIVEQLYRASSSASDTLRDQPADRHARSASEGAD
jgi:succinyl-CoA synthetase beta subunit